MQIREATENDIPGILGVLKASLGETSSKKTEDVWRFKHVFNPFGKSLVLIAVEEDKIIGVRAFMRWQWQSGDEIYATFRAVDTATHPKHQGKGIFKKLTLKAIDLAKEEGGHFIFNTPNGQSLPGYLKMGWEKVNKLKVQIHPTLPFYWFSKSSDEYQQNFRIDNKDLNPLCEQRNKKNKKEKRYFTPKTPEYLRWRYEENPLQSYEILADKEYYIAGYVKQHKYFKELRIVEVLLQDRAKFSQISTIIREWAKKFGANFISMANEDSFGKLKMKGHYGPVMTVRNLNLPKAGYNNLLDLNNFNYSLGDLELF